MVLAWLEDIEGFGEQSELIGNIILDVLTNLFVISISLEVTMLGWLFEFVLLAEKERDGQGKAMVVKNSLSFLS